MFIPNDTELINLRQEIVSNNDLSWKRFKSYYSSKYAGEQLEAKARQHAFYYLIIHKLNAGHNKISLKSIHSILLDLEYDLPKTRSYFASLIKKMRNKSIQFVLTNKSIGTEKSHKKFNKELKEKAEDLYRGGLHHYPSILKKVNEHACLLQMDTIRLTTIKNHFKPIEVQNRLRPFRNGYSWYLANIGHKSHFIKPNRVGEIFEIDGSRFQIPFNNELEKKIDWKSLFVILDVGSGKIVGYSSDNHESSKVILAAFQRFFEFHDFLPEQVIRDNASSYNKDKFRMFEAITKEKGTVWQATSNPQGKPHVEVFFKYFASNICSENPYYVGLGITTKDIDSRYSKEKLKKRIGHRKNLPNEVELDRLIDKLIVEANNHSYQDRKSPNENYSSLIDLSRPKIELNKPDKILLTKNLKWKKVINSEIKIEYQKEKYYYQLDFEKGLKYSRDEILVAWDYSDLSKIYLFDEYMNFQEELKMYEAVPFNIENRSNEEQLKSIKEHLARKRTFKVLQAEVEKNSQRVEERVEGIISFEEMTNVMDKKEQIDAQNKFTRYLLETKNDSERKTKTHKMSTNVANIKTDISKIKDII